MIRGTTANSNDVNSSKVLRQQAGIWLKSLREKRGLSQRQLASFVKVDYYTFISQIESGKGRVPPDKLMEWADALECDRAVFAKKLMRFYDPHTFEMIFGSEKSTG